MTKQKTKKNKVQILKLQQNSGFVLLFAVMLSSILLAITLSVSNISLKEIKFYTSAENANNAFFAADAGAESALFNDKSSGNSFVETGGSGTIQGFGKAITLNGAYPNWNYIVSKIGTNGKGCAKVTVDKSTETTVIISKGYNDGGDVDDSCIQDTNSVERQIELNY